MKPHFIRYAKSRNYRQGLISLLNALEKFIVDQDKSAERKAAQARKRLENIRQNAVATVENAETLHASLLQLLEKESDSTFDLSELTLEAERTAPLIAQARARLQNEPAKAQSLADAAHARIHRAFGRVRNLHATQERAVSELNNLQDALHAIDETISEHGKASMRVTSPVEEATRLADSLHSIAEQTNHDPEAAMVAIAGLQNAIGSLKKQLAQIPAKHEAVRRQRSVVQLLHQRVEEALKAGHGDGVATTNLVNEVTSLKLPAVLAEDRPDYDATLAQLQKATTSLKRIQNSLHNARAEHHFMTTTVPLIALGSVTGLLVLGLVILRVIHVKRRNRLTGQIAAFSERLSSLDETLDGLKEQHRNLPHMDEDFKEPMRGDTLRTYDSAQDALERCRKQWLRLCETRDKAQDALDDESWLTSSGFVEGSRMISESSADAVINTAWDECAVVLDQLEGAHESATIVLTQVDELLEKLDGQLEQIRAARLSTSPYDMDRRSVSEVRDAAQATLTADPIGAEATLTQLLDGVRTLGQWTERVVQIQGGTVELSDKLQDVRAEDKTCRDDGFLFCEEGVDPAPIYPRVEQHLSECRKRLNEGAVDTSNDHLRAAIELVGHADSLIQTQITEREFCHSETHARPAEVDRLRGFLPTVRTQFDELGRDFAEDTWSELKGIDEAAQQVFERTDQSLNDAIQAGSQKTQHYVQAAALFRGVQLELNHLETGLVAVGRRLNELSAMRGRCLEELQQVRQFGDRVQQFLTSRTEDRPRSNQRCERARNSLAQIATVAEAVPANWTEIEADLKSVRDDLVSAEQMAQADIRLAQQAQLEIAEAEREIRSAQSFYDSGYRADLYRANTELSDAENARRRQDYEGAIRLADAAEVSARMATREAQSRADTKRRREARRRREAQQNMMRHSSSGIGVSFGSSSFSGGSSFGGGSSIGGGSSFSSGTSQSGW